MTVVRQLVSDEAAVNGLIGFLFIYDYDYYYDWDIL